MDGRAITSLTNPMVKEIRALALRKRREETGLFVAEGLKLVTDALEAGFAIESLVYKAADGPPHPLLAKALNATRRAGASALAVSDAVLKKMANRDNPQTVLGVFRQRWAGLDSLLAADDALVILLDRVRDPGNLGTILRTADAVAATGLVLVGECTDPFGFEAVRASMGSIAHVPLARAGEAEVLDALRPFRGVVVGTHLRASLDYRAGGYARPCALLMGNESQGLSESLAQVCAKRVRIPMRPGADSLNLAVATALMLFEIERQRL